MSLSASHQDVLHIADTFRSDAFVGQRIAITGGGTGIGLGCALAFAKLGARVAICGRRLDVLQEAAQHIDAIAAASGYGENHVVYASADVRKPEELAAWRDAITEAWGGVDTLIVNAGANFLAPASHISPNGFQTVVSTVLLGSWNTIHAFLPVLSSEEQQKRGGSQILMMAATNGFTSSAYMAHSGAAKAGMLNLTQTLAVEWSSMKIRINAVAPGPVDTEGANKRLWDSDEARAKVARGVPLGRIGNVADCVGPVLFLSSPAARFMTGTTIPVDGGNFVKPVPEFF